MSSRGRLRANVRLKDDSQSRCAEGRGSDYAARVRGFDVTEEEGPGGMRTSVSIRGGPLRVLDDDRVEQRAARFELQAELFLEGRA